MADLATSAAAASLIVGLMTIPAASSTINSSATVSEKIPDTSDRNSSPVKVSRETSSSGFQASIQTAFDRFSLKTSHGSAEAELEQPTSRLEVDRSPSATSWKLTTSSGVLEVEKSSSGVKETLETAEGMLEIERNNGAVSRSFEGEDKQRVLSRYHELRSLMEEKKQEMEQKRQRVEESSRPEVEVIANKSTADGFGNNTREHAVIVNNGLSEVELQGWTLEDDSSSYELPEHGLAPGEKVKVYSEDKDKIETDGEIYDSSLGWNDGSDEATLSNRKGEEVAESSY